MRALVVAIAASLLLLVSPARGFGFVPGPTSRSLGRRSSTNLYGVNPTSTVDANTYNIDLDQAAELWTAKVQESKSAVREAGMPFLDTTSKDHFVDDVEGVEVSRDGGLGIELLELAGGREDGFGITIVTVVTPGGNAEKAGILPGDSIASVAVVTEERDEFGNLEQTERIAGAECLDFDSTISVLSEFPGESDAIILGLKRIRRWPKVQVRVEYPPIQCAEGADNFVDLTLDAGENLQRALLNRRIVMEDPDSPKCDFCGNKCTVSIGRGIRLLSPMSTTEEKIMKKNPDCRVRRMV